MREYYTVGETAKIFNVSTDTLRYYDRIGLLHPWKNGENGYRYYSKAQFEIISMIMLLRSMDTPIEKLMEIIHSDSPDGIVRELRRYATDIDRRIAELQRLKLRAGELDRLITDTCYGMQVETRMVPQLWFMSKPFGAEDELDIDEILSASKQAQEWASTAGIVSTITPENMERGHYHSYERYGYLSEVPCDIRNRYMSVIPERRCICANARVSTVEHYEMDAVYDEVMAYARSHCYRISGDVIERNVLDIYGTDGPEPTMYFKIYAPVEKTN